MPDLLLLSQLLQKAPEGDPLARAALPAAREQFIPPPPIDTQLKGSSFDFEPQGPGSDPSASAPDLSSMQSVSQPPGAAGNTQLSGGEEKKSFWDDSRNTETLKMGISGLLGAGLGKLTGLGGMNVAAAAMQPSIKDLQEKQMMAMKREQMAFEDAYKQAQALPPVVYNDPKFAELLASQQALMKDLADGKVNNTKTLSTFLTEKAKFSKDLEDAEIEDKINQDIKVKDRMAEAEIERADQEAVRYYQIASDPMASAEERKMAEAKIQEIEKIKNEFVLRKEQEANEQKRHDERMRFQGQEVTARERMHKEQMALQRELGLGRIGAQIQVAGGRQKAADIENFKKNFRTELELRAKEGLLQEKDLNTVKAEMAMNYAPQIKQLLGIGAVSGGNMEIGGQVLPLNQILSMNPQDGEWDNDGTPSDLGWQKILNMGLNKLMLTTEAPGMGISNLQGAFDSEGE